MLNQNKIRQLVLEIAWVQFVKERKFSFTSQNIIKSHKFYEYVSWLKNSGFINIHNKNHHMTYYTLTDDGRLLAILYSKNVDIDQKYKIFRENITWF